MTARDSAVLGWDSQTVPSARREDSKCTPGAEIPHPCLPTSTWTKWPRALCRPSPSPQFDLSHAGSPEDQPAQAPWSSGAGVTDSPATERSEERRVGKE